jgi:tagaturonate reductase
MSDFELRAEFEAISLEEVIPVFEADGEGEDAREYLAGLRDRHLHPFLEHRLADISKDHAQKKQRRFAPLIARAESHELSLLQARLRRAMTSNVEGQAMTSFNDSG